jgi:hypothetical protein
VALPGRDDSRVIIFEQKLWPYQTPGYDPTGPILNLRAAARIRAQRLSRLEQKWQSSADSTPATARHNSKTGGEK